MLECEQLDTIFAMSEQKVTDGLITKKMVTKNAYYGKIKDDGQWPLRSGTRIKGFRLGRIGIPDCTGWRPIEDELCSTNLCSYEPDVVQHGHSDYYFSLAQKDLRTDWICLDSVALREMPEQELMHLEDGLRNASRYVHEEFRRSRYLLMGRNKIIGYLTDPGAATEETACDSSAIRKNSWMFTVRDNGEMDECHVIVAVDPAEIDHLAMLSIDMLDYAAERLDYEDAAYLDGVELYDVLSCDRTIASNLAYQENSETGESATQSGRWDLVNLRKSYGTQRVIRDMYSVRNDIHAMRFFPDTVYNDGLSTFDLDDPATWPRFVRVFPYVPAASKVAGIEFVTNEDYLRAPFGISTILNTRVMEVMSFPNVARVAGASKVGGFGYEGTVQWQNPDWPCNVNRDKGFWKMRFRLAAKPNYDEEGYSYFHRIDRSRTIHGINCALPADPCLQEVTAYCFSGMAGTIDSGLGENRAIDEFVGVAP